ncbi:hypothetical protein JTB14_007592 [Gonioctena quinquepunctata]|nr:hypothetical protein JTB14_007592 [Gonioctena quinquepunctata]
MRWERMLINEVLGASFIQGNEHSAHYWRSESMSLRFEFGLVKCGDRERRECAEQAALIVKTLIHLIPIQPQTTKVFRKNSFLQSNMLPENLYNSQNFEIKRSHGFQRVCRAPSREKDSITTSSRRIRLVPVRVFNS